MPVFIRLSLMLAALAVTLAAARAAQPSAGEQRAEVLERMADLLETRYLDEGKGIELAAMLRAANRR